ncbi:hypothetical protein ACG83_40290 [Frankia sp. R43]|uniref:hypothetical protein n=1 Tax=Frankia sp. R43 TaxID=269536 RepID=UPI0006CA21E9|nr:hypothetical protein [Frankia sp. R43]KPM50377.1 hypothetical protein ACG83_40290 [Frankia sp. R43]
MTPPLAVRPRPPAAAPPDRSRQAAGIGGRAQLTVTFRDEPGNCEWHLDEAVGRVQTVLPEARVERGMPGARVLRLPGDGEAVLAAMSEPAGQALTLTAAVLAQGELGAQGQGRLLAAVGALPFTTAEMTDLHSQMPLTSRLPTWQPAGVLAEVAPVIAVHHMADFLVLVDALRALGVAPEAMTVLDKRYAYRNTQRVDAHLRAQGVTVVDWRAAPAALAGHCARADAAGRRPVLIDDGGYLLPVLLDEYPDLVGRFLGLVEQTTSGIAKLARFGTDLPVPVFSVAESRLKATIESYGVADAAVRNLLTLLPQEKWEGKPAVVLGYGRIGEQVAQVLRGRRMRVAVHDNEMVRLVAAHEAGFTTGRSVRRLLSAHQPVLVIGATGCTSLRGDHLDALHGDCFLASVTSRARELALDEIGDDATVLAVAAGLRYHRPGGATITVLADGYPLNFHHAESLPNSYADVVMAALAVGTIALSQNRGCYPAGHNVALTDRVLESSSLLERYYALHGPTT